MINANTHSQTGVWERGRSPVGRTALCPTSIYIPNQFQHSIKTLYANIFCFYQLFICANLRRHQGKPTYGVQSLSARFYFMRILFDGRLKPYPTNFKLVNQKSLTMSDQFKPPQREYHDTKHRIKL